MGKFATKDMAIEAKSILEKQFGLNLPSFIKSIELDADDHGWFLTTKIKNKHEYINSEIKVPNVIDLNGFILKNCIIILG